MITQADIAHWRAQVPWVDADLVEQDLVLSRLIVEIANDPVVGPELVFRGGMCFHKLWLDRPWRYSVARALANLDDKLGEPDFTTDLATLVTEMPDAYSVGDAASVARDVIVAAG